MEMNNVICPYWQVKPEWFWVLLYYSSIHQLHDFWYNMALTLSWEYRRTRHSILSKKCLCDSHFWLLVSFSCVQWTTLAPMTSFICKLNTFWLFFIETPFKYLTICFQILIHYKHCIRLKKILGIHGWDRTHTT